MGIDGKCVVARSVYRATQKRYYISVAWTATADGSVPVAELGHISGYITLAVIIPGVPAPSNGYDVTLLDENGLDVFGSKGLGMSSTDTEQFQPCVDKETCQRVVNSKLRLIVSGNSNAAAQGVCKIYIQE